MISGINNIEKSPYQTEFSPQKITPADTSFEPLNSFYEEDQAIISSQAKMQYELEKFNSGGDNAVELAASTVIAKTTANVEVNVINTKTNMLNVLLGLAE